MAWMNAARRFAIPGAKIFPLVGPTGLGMVALFGDNRSVDPTTSLVLGVFLITSALMMYAMLLVQRHGGFRFRNWVGIVGAHIRLDTEVNEIGNLAPRNEIEIRDWCRLNCTGHWRIVHAHIEFESDDDATLFFLFVNCPAPPKAGPYINPRDLMSRL